MFLLNRLGFTGESLADVLAGVQNGLLSQSIRRRRNLVEREDRSHLSRIHFYKPAKCGASILGAWLWLTARLSKKLLVRGECGYVRRVRPECLRLRKRALLVFVKVLESSMSWRATKNKSSVSFCISAFSTSPFALVASASVVVHDGLGSCSEFASQPC